MSPPNLSVPASAVRPPYSQSPEGRRPYGAHRFDVYSIKAGRQLTLFGRGPLGLWIQLEVDPAVTQLCERPLVLPDCQPRRVVDFWARSNGANRLILLVRKLGSAAEAKRAEQLAAFRIWAADAGCTIEEVVAEEEAGHAVENWTLMLQYCRSYQSSLTADCLERIELLLVAPTPIARLIKCVGGGVASEDADEILRAAIYDLVRRGRARIPALGTARLHDGLEVEPC